MKPFRIFALLAALMFCGLAPAQEAQEEPSLEGGSIESQFEYIFKRSGNYNAEGRRYEVVRAVELDKLRGNVLDSLRASRAEASQLNTTIASQKAIIDNLNTKLEDTTRQLSEVTEEKDSMSLFGSSVSKATYNFILWTIILGLMLFLLLFMFRFRRSNVLTQEAKAKLEDLEAEYEDHRRKALEREQRISRQLQDEINKYRKSK